MKVAESQRPLQKVKNGIKVAEGWMSGSRCRRLNTSAEDYRRFLRSKNHCRRSLMGFQKINAEVHVKLQKVEDHQRSLQISEGEAGHERDAVDQGLLQEVEEGHISSRERSRETAEGCRKTARL